MSDHDLPSQFLDQAQNGEDYDDLLGVEFFGNDDLIPDLDGEQGFEFLDESTNQQDIAPSATLGVQEQQPEVPSSVDVQLPLDFADFLEDGDFVQGTGDSIINDAALGEVPSQPGLPEGAADPSGTGLPTNDLSNLEEIPDFDFSLFDPQLWRDFGNTGADRDIDDVLGISTQVEHQQPDHEQGMHHYRQEHEYQVVGTSSNQNEPLTASRQRSPADTPGADSGYSTAARSRGVTRSLPPAIPHQANNSVVPPGPVDRQEASRARTAAVRPPPAEYHADIDDENFNGSDDESESSSVSGEVEFEENDPLIVPDPPQDKWGLTGKRNGQEVWFNPETGKWRKFQSFHLTKVVSPNNM